MLKVLVIILITQIFHGFDLGCSEQLPRRCPNEKNKNKVICKKDYHSCDAFEGCTDTKYPYLCSNGECAFNFYNCHEKYFTCDNPEYTKCIDGICREECQAIKYSSCNFDKPIRCPSGECVEDIVECAHIKCPADQPFMCPDGVCKGSFFLCKYPENIRVIKKFEQQTRDQLETIYFYDQQNNHAGLLKVNDQLHIRISGVALSEVVQSKLDYNKDYDEIYISYYMKPANELKTTEFIRSVMVKLIAFEDRVENRKPLSLELKLDYINTNQEFFKFRRKNLYCLARLNDKNIWACVAKHEQNSLSNRLTFQIEEDGIYAIVFSPSVEKSLFFEGVYCGMVCRDKRFIFLFIFIGLPFLIFMMYVFFKMYSKKLQEQNITTKRTFIEKKMKEIENVNVDFAGQTIFEKLDEGVQYFVNPVRNEDQENLDNIKMLNAKLEKLKQEKRRVHDKKKKMIYNNKDKIESIRKLRNDIDKLD